MRKVMIFSITVLFLLVSIYPSSAIDMVNKSFNLLNNSNMLYVGGSGPNNFTKIQDAIHYAYDGDTVFVYDDSSPYYENILVYKSIILLGENMATTIIDGNKKGNIIRINTDDVTISGFTLQNSDPDEYGINLEDIVNKNIIIKNNIIKSNGGGILVYHSYYNTISNNYIFNNKDNGIRIGYCGKNEIINNQIFSNDFHGIGLSDSNSNVIKGNIIYSNKLHGINLWYSDSNNILKNTIYLNEKGLYFFESKRNTVIGNIISNCSYGIYLWYSSDNNILYHNGLFYNGENAYQKDCSDNKWDNDYPSGGNYWDDYDGEDNDGDGIGDTPYIIQSDGGRDWYPLMEPFINTPPNKPEIDGPIIGRPHLNYDYTFVTNDTDGDDVWYNICWGDNEIIYSYGPYHSGEEITLSYNWAEKGIYIIYCWAKDTYDEESDITSLKVTMPRTKASFFLWHEWLLERFPLLERLLDNIF